MQQFDLCFLPSPLDNCAPHTPRSDHRIILDDPALAVRESTVRDRYVDRIERPPTPCSRDVDVEHNPSFPRTIFSPHLVDEIEENFYPLRRSGRGRHRSDHTRRILRLLYANRFLLRRPHRATSNTMFSLFSRRRRRTQSQFSTHNFLQINKP